MKAGASESAARLPPCLLGSPGLRGERHEKRGAVSHAALGLGTEQQLRSGSPARGQGARTAGTSPRQDARRRGASRVPAGSRRRSPHSPPPRMLTSDRANHSSPPLSANPAEAPPAAQTLSSASHHDTRHPAPPAERALGRGLREPSPRDVLSSSTLELDRSPQLHTRR